MKTGKLHNLFYDFLRFVVRWGSKLAFRLKVENREVLDQEKPYILCANHLSWVDGLIMAVIQRKHRIRMMVKKEAFKNKFVAWCCKLVFFFPVDRNGADVNAIKTAMRTVKEGHPLVIFPEGTRSKTQELLPFHDGPISLAHQLKIPIITAGRTNRVKIWGKVAVHLSEPFYVESKERRLTSQELHFYRQKLRDAIENDIERAKELL